MKIGILSMQRINNYGSFLQAYALKSTIESLGHKVEFVDYEVEECLVKGNVKSKYNLKTFFPKVINKLVIFARQGYTKNKYLDKKYDEYLLQLDISKQKNYKPKLDVLVIGSDEVFNCLQSNELVGYSRQLFGKDNNANKLITYAASFGTTTLEGLIKYNIKDEVKSMLSKFECISVRDNNSGYIVEQLLDKKPIFNLDPVFIYNFDNLIPKKVDMKNYIILYAYGNRITSEEGKVIRKFAKKHNKKIITLGVEQRYADICVQATPFEVLAYVKNADFVITDTFHGSVFSIKYNKKFATIVRESNKQKLSDLLKRFELQNRQVENIEDLEKVLLCDVNYERINKFIEEQVNYSVNYLRDSIK